MNQIKKLLEQDETITDQIACAKKIYYNEINNNLNCSLNLLQTITSNYDLVKTIFSTFKSEENLNEYIKYLENQSTESQTNKYIEYLQEIINSSEEYSFAQSFVSSILDLNVDTNILVWNQGKEDNTEFNVSLSCPIIDLILEYNYYPNKKLYSYCLTLNDVELEMHKFNKQSFEYYKEHLIEIIKEYNLPIEKIKEFNKIILKWLIKCGGNLDIFDDIIQDFDLICN